MYQSAPTILLTGAGGFIGWETAKQLLERETRVIGIDNLSWAEFIH